MDGTYTVLDWVLPYDMSCVLYHQTRLLPLRSDRSPLIERKPAKTTVLHLSSSPVLGYIQKQQTLFALLQQNKHWSYFITITITIRQTLSLGNKHSARISIKMLFSLNRDISTFDTVYVSDLVVTLPRKLHSPKIGQYVPQLTPPIRWFYLLMTMSLFLN